MLIMERGILSDNPPRDIGSCMISRESVKRSGKRGAEARIGAPIKLIIGGKTCSISSKERAEARLAKGALWKGETVRSV